MSTNYPGTIQTFTDPSGTSLLTSPDHAGLHTDMNDTVEALQNTIGTTAGTNILKDFAGGQFPARVNSGGTIVQTLTGGTINNSTFGTVSVTGGTINSVAVQNWNGWEEANETWVYASADDPTFTFTAAGDLTSKYSVGMKIKLTQTTAKDFFITKIGHSGGTTTFTVYGGTDYDLANAAITSPYYSTMKAPQGFPLDPTKWTLEYNLAGTLQASPTISTYYNLGGSLAVHIGVWRVYYSCSYFSREDGSSTTVEQWITLSTANNSQSDVNWTYVSFLRGGTADVILGGAAFKEGVLALTSKATYYLNTKVEVAGVDSLGLTDLNTNTTKVHIRAICAFL